MILLHFLCEGLHFLRFICLLYTSELMQLLHIIKRNNHIRVAKVVTVMLIVWMLGASMYFLVSSMSLCSCIALPYAPSLMYRPRSGTNQFFDWLVDWLIDWLIDCCYHHHHHHLSSLFHSSIPRLNITLSQIIPHRPTGLTTAFVLPFRLFCSIVLLC